MPPISKPSPVQPAAKAPFNATKKGPASAPAAVARKGPSKPSADEHGEKPNIMAALEELDSTWQGAEAKEGGSFEKLPEGKYQVKIEDAEVGYSKSSARLQVNFTLLVVSGQFANRKLWKYDGLDNEESIGWFKGGLARLGVEAPTSMPEVPGILSELKGTFCEVAVKHRKDSGDNVNVYFQKALDSGDIAEEGLEQVDAGGEQAAEAPADEPKNWAVKDRVQADFDGDWYSGEVTKVNAKARKATVKFEDGDVQELNFDDLEPFNPDGEQAESAAPVPVELGFDDSAITETHQKQIDTLARKHGFNPDDYAEWCPLISDMCEHCGIGGSIPNVASVIKSLSAVKVM